MSQALYTSKTGIDAGQTHINVVANNVANINTTAYKTANVTFSTLFSRTLHNKSTANFHRVFCLLETFSIFVSLPNR